MRRTWLILAAAVAIAAILGSVGVASAQEGTTTTKDSTVQGPGPLVNGGLRLTDVVPRGGATGVPKDQTVKATFNKALDPATVNNTTFRLKDKQTGTFVDATVSVSNNNPKVARLSPTTNLTHGDSYKAIIEGGATGVLATDGSQLSSVNTSQGIHFDGTQAYWSFKVK